MKSNGKPENSVPLLSVTMRNGNTFPKATQSAYGAAAPAPAKKLSLSEAREARIRELREQYLAGAYKVDALELSRKLVDAHLK